MRRFPSFLAFAFVLFSAWGLSFWWIKSKPSFYLYQAHRRLGQGDQAAIIAEYSRLLENKDLTLEDQIKFRKALGEFYLRAVQENTSFSLYIRDDYSVGHKLLGAAKAEFQKVLQLDDQDGFAHYALGQILLWEKLENFALEELEISVKSLPQNPEPLRILSLIYQERGELSKGLEYALRSVAINPTYDQSRLALISAYQMLGDHNNVYEQYEKLSSSFRSLPDIRARHAFFLVQEGFWEKGLKEITGVFSVNPSNGEVHLHFGKILLLMGRYDEASAHIAQSAALLPHSIWPLVWQAESACHRGACDEAARISQLLVQSFPRWAWAHLAQANSFICKNMTIQAMSELDEALRLSPDFLDARRIKARLLLDKGQYQELGTFLRSWLDEKQHEAQAYLYLAESFFFQGQFDLAQEMAEAAIKRNQREGMAFVWLGLSRMKKNDKEGAGRAFSNALSVNPIDPVIQCWGLYYKSMAGFNDFTEIELKRHIQKNPGLKTLHFLLGKKRLMDKNYSEAMESFQNELEGRPYHLHSQLGLIESAWALGENEKADAALSAALEINSRNKEVLFWRTRIRKKH